MLLGIPSQHLLEKLLVQHTRNFTSTEWALGQYPCTENISVYGYSDYSTFTRNSANKTQLKTSSRMSVNGCFFTKLYLNIYDLQWLFDDSLNVSRHFEDLSLIHLLKLFQRYSIENAYSRWHKKRILKYATEWCKVKITFLFHLQFFCLTTLCLVFFLKKVEKKMSLINRQR